MPSIFLGDNACRGVAWWSRLHPQLRQGWLLPLAPAPHAGPVTSRRHGHVELAADLSQPHAGDPVALGHGQGGF